MVHNVHWWDRSSIGCSCPKNLSQISMKNHGHMIFGFFPFSCNCTVLSVSIIPTRELLFSFQFFSISFCTALSDSTNWLDSLQFFFFSLSEHCLIILIGWILFRIFLISFWTFWYSNLFFFLKDTIEFKPLIDFRCYNLIEECYPQYLI